MALLPIQGTTEGDFVVHLVPVDDQDSMSTVADKIAHHSVGRRVAAQNKTMAIRFHGETLPADATPASAGVGPMDFLQAFYEP